VCDVWRSDVLRDQSDGDGDDRDTVGNVSYLVNGTLEHTLTRPNGDRSTFTASIHEYVLAKDGEPFTVSEHVEQISDIVAGDVAFSCVVSYAVQLANGEIRIDRLQIQCTPS
jgi:hypothetical protein